MILTTFKGAYYLVRKCVYFGGVSGHFGALMGARGVTDVQCGLPECGGDWMKRHIGSE